MIDEVIRELKIRINTLSYSKPKRAESFKEYADDKIKHIENLIKELQLLETKD
jgi:hypothetical protein